MKDIFTRMSVREKAGIAIAAIAVFIVFVDRFIVDPMTARMNQISREIKASEGDLRVAMELVKQKGAVSAEYKKYSAYVRKSGSDEEEQTKMLGEIEELARKSGVSIASMKPVAPKTVDFHKRYEVELEVDGEMEPVINFLYQLSNSPQLLRTERMSLNPKEKDSSIVKSKINVTKVVMP
jgi:Tfp pilus assembly protein PilO